MAKSTLPGGLISSDLEYPEYESGEKIAHTAGDYGRLTLYNTGRFGWVIATLLISKGKAGRSNRTYGISLNNEIVTVGDNNHTTETLTVYIKESRVDALQTLIDLYSEGMERAGAIRDRRGARRAQGQEMRANGRTSWRWTV